jgi:hypothetical protein
MAQKAIDSSRTLYRSTPGVEIQASPAGAKFNPKAARRCDLRDIASSP